MRRVTEPLPIRKSYDWDTLFDGSVWELTSPEDFEQSIQSFRNYVMAVARKRKVRVSTQVVNEATLRLQARQQDE